MLEARARQRSSKALEKLLDLTPPTARLVTDEGEKSVPLAEVQPGMLLRLTTGDRVPVDGEITQGEAWLDEAMLTGEPIPQQKGEGAVSCQCGWQPYYAVTNHSHGAPGPEQQARNRSAGG